MSLLTVDLDAGRKVDVMKKVYRMLVLAALASAIPAMGCSAGAGSGDDDFKKGSLLSSGQTVLKPVTIGDERGAGIYVQSIHVEGDGSGDIDCYLYSSDWRLLNYTNAGADYCRFGFSCHREIKGLILEMMKTIKQEECSLERRPFFLQIMNNGNKATRYRLYENTAIVFK